MSEFPVTSKLKILASTIVGLGVITDLLEDVIVTSAAFTEVTMGLTFDELTTRSPILKVVRNGHTVNKKNNIMIAIVLFIKILLGIVFSPLNCKIIIIKRYIYIIE